MNFDRKKETECMQILIMRHGTAHSVSAQHDDAARPLTEAGIREVTEVSRHIARLGTNLSQLRSSPYVRAQQTASILAQALGISKVETDTEITPHGNVDDILFSLAAAELPSVGLVSHQPLVGLLLGKLLGKDPDNFMISPATFALVKCELTAAKVKSAKLICLIQPSEISS